MTDSTRLIGNPAAEDAARAPAGGQAQSRGPLPDYNPFVSPDREDPYSFYAWSRREVPVHYSTSLGAWMVTRYDDIVAILQDPRRFSSKGSIPSAFNNPPEVLKALSGSIPEASTIVDADPPEHTRMRKLLNRAFSSRRINAMQPLIRRLADELIDAFSSDGRADLVSQYANPLVQTVISLLLGVPREDIARVQSWTDDLVLVWNPFAPLPEKISAARRVVDYERYIAALIEERRASPEDDILSDLLHGHGDDLEPLTDGDVLYFFRGARLAGHDTTRDLITSAILTMLTHREHWDRAREDARVIPAIIEETLRRDAPHKGLMRTTTEEVEVGDVKLPQGSQLLLLFGSANRDETHFPNPDVFDIHRKNVSDHIAFGKGIHVCTGVHIARTEARISLEALVQRLPGTSLAQDFAPTYIASFFFRGLEHLHVSL
jgi:cytochrome P450